MLATVYGIQTPTIEWYPEYDFSSGQDCLDIAETCNLYLDPWQQYVLQNAMSQRVSDWKWHCMEVGVMVARQNGKGAIIEARELGGLFVFGEQVIVHSAHEFATVEAAHRRMEQILDENSELRKKVLSSKHSHGQEGIYLKTGQVLLYKTRTKSSGRGLSGDLVFLDEAMILHSASLAALFPTMSARPNPQLWYMGSAVDEEVHEHGEVFASVRERGREGDDPRLAWFEWSNPGGVKLDSIEARRRANPSLGYRISGEYIQAEYRAMRRHTRKFEVERLSVDTYWPKLGEDVEEPVVDIDAFEKLGETRETLSPLLTKHIAFAIDMPPNRKHVAIAAAIALADGRTHTEVGYFGNPSGAIAYIKTLAGKYNPYCVVVDALSPAFSLVSDLVAEGIEPEITNSTQMAAACGGFEDAINAATITHLNDPLVLEALESASRREMVGGGWAFQRKGVNSISPLVAVTLALWGIRVYMSTAEPESTGGPAFSVENDDVADDFDALSAGF